MLRRGNIVVFDKYYLDNFRNLRVTSDQFPNSVDQFNNRFGSYVSGSSLSPENKYSMRPGLLRIILDPEIQIQNI